MKFYGNGVVWDPAEKKRLCKFIDGVYETKDPGVIAKLKARGYGHDDPVNPKMPSDKATRKVKK